MLSVSYFGGTPAVVVYKIDAEKLVGEWTMGGTEGKTYAETLTRVPEGKPPDTEAAGPARRPRRAPNRSLGACRSTVAALIRRGRPVQVGPYDI